MKLSFALPLAAAATTSLAQPIESKPFTLKIASANSTYNGKFISACHAGAAIETLCLGDATSFQFNTTKGVTAPVSGYSAPGNLVFTLQSSGDSNVSEPMSLSVDPTNNVAVAIFSPIESYSAQQVVFSQSGQMGIISYVAVGSIFPTGNSTHTLSNWYICETTYGGYILNSLAWMIGDGTGKPNNPTCVKVQVNKT